MLYIFGISINIFLILLLVSKKHKVLADKFLLVWLIIICCHLLLFVAATTSIGNKYPEVFVVAPLFPLLHGPMLYLYTAEMTKKLPGNIIIWALHFLPFIIISFLVSPFFFLTTQEKEVVINSGGEGYELQIHINNYAMILSGIVYVIWLLALLREHKKNIADHFSNDEKIKLNWLRYLIYGLGVIWILVIAQNVQGVSYDNYIFGSGVALVLIIGYFGIRQGRIFNPAISQPSSYPVGNRFEDEFKSKPGDTENDITKSEETPIDGSANEATITVKKKYANSGLTDIASQNLYQELKKLMEEEKVYTEPELTLSALAEKLNIYPNYLSQVINEKEGKSFYDYINTLRVEEFIRQVLLPENGKFTMMSLAADCGFNSKSSFNKNFKKVTGQSPSAYLSKRRQDPGS